MEGPGAGVGSPSDDEYIPHSTTDENFRSRESELVTTDEKASMYYVNLPVANLDKIIIDHKEILKDISDQYNMSGEEYRRHGERGCGGSRLVCASPTGWPVQHLVQECRSGELCRRSSAPGAGVRGDVATGSRQRCGTSDRGDRKSTRLQFSHVVL